MFVDPFCGSGGVSRLARHLGFRVLANDWEPYASVVTAACLELLPDEIEPLFASRGGLASVYDELNHRSTPREPYIARHYAPAHTSAPRLGRERLFYTAENARKIDAIREAIDEFYPPEDEAGKRARTVLIASLLYQASVRANTSGVFKAYHRGFGGLGRDALSRILAPVHLEPPHPGPGPRGTVACEDAERFLRRACGDVCYLDPPYAGHQYGSNYFMLNTIVRWDRPPVDDRRDGQGLLLNKAGIDPRWRETKSAFCSRPAALGAISRAVDSVDAGVLIVSYSSDGIVPIEELAELLAAQGALDLRSLEYTTYRGGKQSITRRGANGEFIFVVDRNRRGGRVPARVARHIAAARVREIGSRRFDPARVRDSFELGDGRVELAPGWHAASADAYRLRVPEPPPDLSIDTIDEVTRRLERACLDSHLDELRVLLALCDGRESSDYLKRIVWCLRSFAHRTYRSEFQVALGLIGGAIDSNPRRYDRIAGEVEAVRRRAELREGGP